MTLQDYLVIFRKNWVVIVICTLVAAGLSVAWTLTRTPTYEATTQLYVSVRTADSPPHQISTKDRTTPSKQSHPMLML